MNKEKLKESIESNYDIKVLAIEKVKNSYRLETENTNYAIKIIEYDFPHFYFILSAIEHLQKREFHKIPKILNNKDGTKYIQLENSYAYLTEWIPSRVSNYDNPIELSKVAQKLGELHTCSTGFNINNDMKPRIGWYSWINVFNTRCNEILDFKNRINQKAYKSKFDYIYLSNIEAELERGKESIENLKRHKYIEIMDKEVMKMGFCHHDYAHHNILVDDNDELNIIDFDYCILDSHLHDLSSLLIRAMKGAKWGKEKADLIIKNYCKSNGLYEDEFKLIGDFIRFPQTFWQIGIQYYWEQQPWGESFFEEKINKYLEDVEYREEFLDSYFK
ncbi:CotS family spore coat protein [Clostridium sp. 1001271B_151109_B4]|uniref:CotS family spore coat protein n=1 Tax=Clostridium sp. 1001271B_151109_B4 TaxID=2787148 RepID=UPI0018AA30A9|nr:CotS family spore coat protein [Clostridium sp. 1001271B_151109_B4]